MHTVLCAVVVVLAGILHVLETYRYYRQGFEEGYEKGQKEARYDKDNQAGNETES